MHDERERDDIDARVRAALTVDEIVSRRIVERALGADAGATRTRRLLPRALFAAAVIAIVVAGLWQMRTSRTAEFAIAGKQSWVVVSSADGRRWIVGPGARTPRRGSYVIVVSQ